MFATGVMGGSCAAQDRQSASSMSRRAFLMRTTSVAVLAGVPSFLLANSVAAAEEDADFVIVEGWILHRSQVPARG